MSENIDKIKEKIEDLRLQQKGFIKNTLALLTEDPKRFKDIREAVFENHSSRTQIKWLNKMMEIGLIQKVLVNNKPMYKIADEGKIILENLKTDVQLSEMAIKRNVEFLQKLKDSDYNYATLSEFTGNEEKHGGIVIAWKEEGKKRYIKCYWYRWPPELTLKGQYKEGLQKYLIKKLKNKPLTKENIRRGIKHFWKAFIPDLKGRKIIHNVGIIWPGTSDLIIEDKEFEKIAEKLMQFWILNLQSKLDQGCSYNYNEFLIFKLSKDDYERLGNKKSLDFRCNLEDKGIRVISLTSSQILSHQEIEKYPHIRKLIEKGESPEKIMKKALEALETTLSHESSS